MEFSSSFTRSQLQQMRNLRCDLESSLTVGRLNQQKIITNLFMFIPINRVHFDVYFHLAC